MGTRAHLKLENTRSGIQMLRLCIDVVSDRRREERGQDRVTISFQEIWDEFGELIGRTICGDTHTIVDVKRRPPPAYET